MLNTPTFNSGIIGGNSEQMIDFCSQTLTLAKMTKKVEHDQAILNIQFFLGNYFRRGIFFTENLKQSRVRHVWFNCLEAPFSNVSGLMNRSLPASVIHCYYQSNDAFICSILHACPRPYPTMGNYLTKYTKPVEDYKCNTILQGKFRYVNSGCKSSSYIQEVSRITYEEMLFKYHYKARFIGVDH